MRDTGRWDARGVFVVFTRELLCNRFAMLNLVLEIQRSCNSDLLAHSHPSGEQEEEENRGERDRIILLKI